MRVASLRRRSDLLAIPGTSVGAPTHMRVRACMREISVGIVGSEAQLGVATNEHESSLDAGGRVALCGHLR